MPDFEFEFNQQDRELVVTQDVGIFGNTDYIRLTIYPTEAINNIVTLPGTNNQAIFYSSISETEFDINVSPFGAGLDELRLKTIGGIKNNDFKIYQKSGIGDVDGGGGNISQPIYIKPNEIFNDFELPQGDYRIQVDFLNQLSPSTLIPSFYQFIVKQISTSRKEVRLKLLNKNIDNNSDDILNITSELNNNELEFIASSPNEPESGIKPNPNYKYQFKHILNIGTGDHIPIMNYTFDKFTDGASNQSLILKLYEPLPSNVSNLSQITIEKEVITTQIQDIFYFSDVPDVMFGDGLIPDAQESWINPDGNDVEFENYNDLTSSIDSITLSNIISSSYDYPNLNTDFSKFENHTQFGSAKKKLQNFNTKVETIQGHYAEISQSLSDDGVAVAGDSTFLIQKRKDLFEKINKEIQTFTPYERFLYYDGQSHSTSSAPGLGKNYADTIPVTQQVNTGEAITLNGFDGFNVVYQHSDKNLITGTGAIPSTHVDLFTGKYQVHDKPFFNYSSSIYLSFLLKGTDNIPITSPLNNENSRKIIFSGGQEINLPVESFYVNDILKPATSQSQYRRFIYQVSSSYFIPRTDDNDMAEVRDFGNSSTEITVLNTNLKTGSLKIKDSTGRYPTTVITQSGVPFKGSVMPAGELFRINIPKNYTDDEDFTQTFITNVNVTFNDPVDVLPFDIVAHTGSTTWTTWYNGMLTKAENFDTDNIHSFENNLPLYIQESSEYNDMKDFLSLQGEQYDLIKNHIDSMGTIHKRGYKKTNSPPNNTLPILLNNMGWQAINPFTSSLADYYSNQLSSGTSVENITENTWRKTLNNLIYIYKSKGTKNSVRALLNTYGYPADVLQFQEFGGSTEESNPRIFTNTPPLDSGIDLSLNRQSGSFSFTSKKEKLHRYIFSNKPERTLNFDWWMNDADINSVQFIYKHKKTTNTQTILESSGSGALKAEATLQVLTGTPSDFDGKTFVLSSSDGVGKTYIFDDDSDGATGTTDSSGRVRIQLNGLTLRDEIANEISNSISSTNGHKNKIDAVDFTQFLTDTGQNFITSDGDLFFANSSGSIVLTQVTASVGGNNPVTTNAPSMSVSGFFGGSDNQTLWDLRLIPDVVGLSSSFEFRLNNTSHASSSITASNALSMSTNYSKILDGQLWNVMLQRMSSSISGSGTNEYRLHTALQDEASIQTYNYVTMSVSGGLVGDSTTAGKGFYANQNFQSSGSRGIATSSNLFVGETLSGSLAEIRGWATTLSTSKFRQHTLNKFSTVGNTINSHKDDLVYHFKLNENYSSASYSSSAQTLKIFDSAPTTTYSDYSFTKSANLFTGSLVYGFDFISTHKLSLQDNISKINNNTILINPKQSIIGNLHPIKSPIQSLTNTINKKPKFKTSPRLELYRSPQTFVDNFILDTLSGFNLETLYGNPINYYSQSYNEFDTFRENFFDAHPIEVNVNKFIRAHESMFNHSIVEGIKTLVPARSTFSSRDSNFGVEIRPTILEKQKYENEENSVETNPNTATGSIKFIENTEYKQSSFTSTFEALKTGSISINITNTATLESTKSGSHNIDVKLSDSLGGKEILSIYNSVKEGNVNVLTQKNARKGVSGSGEVSRYDDIEGVSFTGTFEQPHSQSISLGNNYQTSSMGGDVNFEDNKYITPPFLQPGGYSGSIVTPHSASFIYLETTGQKNIPPTLANSSVPTSKDGTIDYALRANESYTSVHKNWGTGKNDVHFLNMAADSTETGSSIPDIAATCTITITDYTELNNGDKVNLIATDGTNYDFTVGDQSSVNGTWEATTSNNATATNLMNVINTSSGPSGIRFTATVSDAVVTATQASVGAAGNTAVTLTDSGTAGMTKTNFIGGQDYLGNHYNVGHIDTRFVFHAIGDHEYYSGSIHNETNFTDSSRFYNRLYLTDGVNGSVTYESIKFGKGDGIVTGKMMGKTRYFSTGSDGNIILPSNHVSRYVDHYLNNLKNGTQNVNPGILNVQHEDYSTASFYRVKVTGGENQIYIRSGQPSVDNGSKIIYN